MTIIPILMDSATAVRSRNIDAETRKSLNMNTLSRLSRAFFSSPLLWGGLASIGFYALIFYGPLGHDLVKRYFAGHPVLYMETALFFVGVSALIIKLFDTLGQRAAMIESPLGKPIRTTEAAEHSEDLLDRLGRLFERRKGEVYVNRLRAALEHVRRRGSADALDDELKYLSDVDAARLYAGHGLFRVIVWAIPILGFLGTVIGITMALNGVDFSAPDKSMFAVLKGLGLKFDTTALALSLAMVLMFLHLIVEKSENRLLEDVDRRVQNELGDRFEMVPSGVEGQLVAMRKLSESMLQMFEKTSLRQAQLWNASFESAAGQWSRMTDSAADKVQSSMSTAAGELSNQAGVLQKAVEAVGEVARLEDALNRNLETLAGAKHFQQTVLSLAAAVNMLSARLAETPGAAPIKLEPTRRSTNAA